MIKKYYAAGFILIEKRDSLGVEPDSKKKNLQVYLEMETWRTWASIMRLGDATDSAAPTLFS